MAALMPSSLLFLSLRVLGDEPVPTFRAEAPEYFDTPPAYMFGMNLNTERCPAGATKSATRGLRRTLIHMVLYDKHTRLILQRGGWREVYPTDSTYAVFSYDGNFTSTSRYAFGVYFLVLRSGEERVNESPVSNPYVRDTKDIFHSGKHSGLIKEIPGTGSDFSKMYHESPHMFYYFIKYKDRSGKERIVWEYKPESCAKTAHWVSNEGFYKLDPDTHELTAIYYHPTVTDFFY